MPKVTNSGHASKEFDATTTHPNELALSPQGEGENSEEESNGGNTK